MRFTEGILLVRWFYRWQYVRPPGCLAYLMCAPPRRVAKIRDWAGYWSGEIRIRGGGVGYGLESWVLDYQVRDEDPQCKMRMTTPRAR